MLLWMVPSLVPGYAAESHTYYAFVMYGPEEDGGWCHATQPVKELMAGSYRFQIVYKKPDKSWVALRGEFDFVTDVENGGVQVSSRRTLTEYFSPSGDSDSSLWNDKDSNPKKYWETAGRPHVQPLIEQMKIKVDTGDPDPNFMRFLVRKPDIEEFWEAANDKNYQIYPDSNGFCG